MFEITYVGDEKHLRSSGYNYNFNMKTGYFERWGKTFEDDPKFAPAPEIVDFEVGCKCSFGCPFCYKNNTPNGGTTSFETFKSCFDKFPKSVCQIAFGIGDIDSVPDLWKMMEYCRVNKVIPNITINGDRLTDYYIRLLQDNCG